jgi:uncharacterized protein
MPLDISSHAHLRYAWLVTASFLAGAMNAMAGGGSFLSFPALLAMGVPPVEGNATNTVALWPGQATSIWALRGDLRRDLLPVILAASVMGGVGGAVVLLRTKQVTFLHLVPWLLLIASLLFGISGPVSRWLRRRSNQPHEERKINVPLLFVMLLPVCFYIGYFGAGAGFLVMTALALLGLEEMHELNSLKVVAAGVSNLSAVFTFIFRGAILWHYCLISMVFAGVGGYIGAHYARKMNAEALRAVVVVTGLAVAGYFFWKLR